MVARIRVRIHGSCHSSIPQAPQLGTGLGWTGLCWLRAQNWTRASWAGEGLGQHIADLYLILVGAGFGSNAVLTVTLAWVLPSSPPEGGKKLRCQETIWLEVQNLDLKL